MAWSEYDHKIMQTGHWGAGSKACHVSGGRQGGGREIAQERSAALGGWADDGLSRSCDVACGSRCGCRWDSAMRGIRVGALAYCVHEFFPGVVMGKESRISYAAEFKFPLRDESVPFMRVMGPERGALDRLQILGAGFF